MSKLGPEDIVSSFYNHGMIKGSLRPSDMVLTEVGGGAQSVAFIIKSSLRQNPVVLTGAGDI